MPGAAWLPIAVHGHRSVARHAVEREQLVVDRRDRDLPVPSPARISNALVGVDRWPDRRVDGRLVARLRLRIQFGRLAVTSSSSTSPRSRLRSSIERRERQLFLLARDEPVEVRAMPRSSKRRGAQAEEGNEVKLRFLANMSHEFRTPMHGHAADARTAVAMATANASDLVEQARALRSGAGCATLEQHPRVHAATPSVASRHRGPPSDLPTSVRARGRAGTGRARHRKAWA